MFAVYSSTIIPRQRVRSHSPPHPGGRAKQSVNSSGRIPYRLNLQPLNLIPYERKPRSRPCFCTLHGSLLCEQLSPNVPIGVSGPTRYWFFLSARTAVNYQYTINIPGMNGPWYKEHSIASVFLHSTWSITTSSWIMVGAASQEDWLSHWWSRDDAGTHACDTTTFTTGEHEHNTRVTTKAKNTIYQY